MGIKPFLFLPQGTQTRQGQQATGILKKHTEADSNTPRNQVKQEAK